MQHANLINTGSEAVFSKWLEQKTQELFPQDDDRAKTYDFLTIRPHTEGARRSYIGIDDIREINKFVHSSGIYSKTRAVAVVDAGKMTHQAANALLKVLEGPPDNRIIFLQARDAQDVLPTIISRCVTEVVQFRAGMGSDDGTYEILSWSSHLKAHTYTEEQVENLLDSAIQSSSQNIASQVRTEDIHILHSALRAKNALRKSTIQPGRIAEYFLLSISQ